MNLFPAFAVLALSASLQAQTPAARGAYLIKTMGCNDCHTPLKMGPKGPEPDMDRFLSGHPADLKMPPAPDLGKGPWVWMGSGSMTAFHGPWGTTFAANLTSDKETGMGAVSEKDFIQIFRTGRHLGKGRPVLPPMPVAAVNEATDEDIKAIYAFLQTTKPVRNAVPDILPPRS